MTEVDKQYSQTVKDALAVNWAENRFRIYLLGVPWFKIITPHKPFISLFNKATIKLPPRIEKCARCWLRTCIIELGHLVWETFSLARPCAQDGGRKAASQRTSCTANWQRAQGQKRLRFQSFLNGVWCALYSVNCTINFPEEPDCYFHTTTDYLGHLRMTKTKHIYRDKYSVSDYESMLE